MSKAEPEETSAEVEFLATSAVGTTGSERIRGVAGADEINRVQADDLKVKTWIRKGVFLWGSVFLSLGAVDGALDILNASAYYFGATGVSLVIGAITGRTSKVKDAVTG